MNILIIAHDTHYESMIKSQLDTSCQFELIISADIPQIIEQLNHHNDDLQFVFIDQSSTDLTVQLLQEIRHVKCMLRSTIIVLSAYSSTDVITTLTKAGAHAILNLPNDNNKFQQLFSKLTTEDVHAKHEQAKLQEILKSVANKMEAVSFGIKELEQNKLPLRPAKQIAKESILKSLSSSGNQEIFNVEAFTRGLVDNEKKH